MIYIAENNLLLVMPLHIKNRDYSVNFIYETSIPLDPQDLIIKPEPDNIVLDKIIDNTNEVVSFDDKTLEVIKKECKIFVNNLLSRMN